MLVGCPVEGGVRRQDGADALLLGQVAGVEEVAVLGQRRVPGQVAGGREESGANLGTTSHGTPCPSSWLATATNRLTGVNRSTTLLRTAARTRTSDQMTGPRPARPARSEHSRHFLGAGPEQGSSWYMSRFVAQTWL